MLKGIRGATTADENSIESIKNATLELFSELIKKNSLTEDIVSYVEFSVTKDLDAVYPAKFIRQNLGWNKTAFMCVQEMTVKNSLPKCIRVLLLADIKNEPEFIYLKGASGLRK